MAAKKGAKKFARSKKSAKKPAEPTALESRLEFLLEDFIQEYVVLDESASEISELNYLMKPEKAGPDKGRARDLFIGQAIPWIAMKEKIKKFAKSNARDFKLSDHTKLEPHRSPLARGGF